ncbi:MAG: hypothetical protein D6834_00450 [Aquificota bacterium]|nr:MAG: hypothetical protein D6834_00450 [Aquificota bacterium]
MKLKIRSFLLLFILIFIFLFIIEDIFPIATIPNVISQDVVIKKPENYKKVNVVFNISTEYNGNSLITLKDIIKNASNNQFILIDYKNPLFFEGNYNNRYIYVYTDIICKKIFSINKESSGFINFLRKIKYYLFYLFDKKDAFYEKYKLLDKNQFFKTFNPITDSCFIGNSKAYISFKKVSDLIYPDLKNQLKLITNNVYVKKDFDNLTFINKKKMLFNNINKGMSFVSFYYNLDFDFYIKTQKGEYPLGSSLNLNEKPLIYVRKPLGNYIIAVYKNGEIYKYYKSSFIIKKKIEGYYFFVVYKYSRNMGDFYFSLDPVIITNPIFIQ